MRVTGFALLLVMGCSQGLEPVTDETDSGETDTDTDTDMDTDTDSDSDSDSDADTDTDTDTDTDAVECTTPYTTPNIGWGGSTCLTGTISCGQTIEANTEFGSTVINRDSIESWGCFGDDSVTTNYDAPERVYELYLTEGQTADILLESPCNTLTLKALMTATRCPPSSHNITCSSADRINPYDQDVSVSAIGGDRAYQIVVDGRDGANANFRLSVDCN